MNDAIFIGNRRDAALFRAAGVVSFAPARSDLAERVIAERKRCQRLAMTAETFAALPPGLARELRESDWPRLVIIATANPPGTLRQVMPHLRPGASPPLPS